MALIGYSACKRSLRDLQRSLTPGSNDRTNKVDRLLRELVYDASSLASKEYKVAQNIGIRDADKVRIEHPKISGDTAIFSVSGENLYFVEFGTGILHNKGSRSEAAARYGFTPASWSASHEKYLVSPLVDKLGGRWRVPDGVKGNSVKGGKHKWGWDEGHEPVDAMYSAFHALSTYSFYKRVEDIFGNVY